MVATVDERLAALEDRVGKVEAALDRSKRPAFGITIEEARERLTQPVERGQQELEQLYRIFGRFEGPPDLSSRMREYLYGERE